MTSAVVFDLWETLIDFRDASWYEARRRIESVAGVSPDEFDEAWESCRRLRETGPIRDAVATLGWSDDAVETVLRLRREFTRRALVPRDGAVETIEALRGRGLRVGLISVCTEEVAELWPETPFAPLVEEPVFSCSVGMTKPEPEIYLLACEKLGVEAADAVFVGDGANDELAGAERVGMRAVLIHRPGEDPPWPEVRNWSGPRVTALPQLLELV